MRSLPGFLLAAALLSPAAASAQQDSPVTSVTPLPPSRERAKVQRPRKKAERPKKRSGFFHRLDHRKSEAPRSKSEKKDAGRLKKKKGAARP